MGVKGIIVSNHGGRQLDAGPSCLEVLPHIVKAVKGSECQVLLDSGVRSGSDVVKALALGASAILIGRSVSTYSLYAHTRTHTRARAHAHRPVLWGLSMGGAKGVVAVVNTLLEEVENTLGLCGSTLEECGQWLLKPDSKM